LGGLFFGIPIMATYYYHLGLSPTMVLALQSIISITAVIVEIPTGYPCDRFGARPVIVIGFAGHATCSLAFWQCRTFWQFAAVLVATAVFWSLISGATSVLIFTTFGLDASQRYDKSAIRATAIGKIVSIAGGTLMVLYGDTSLPFALQPIVYAAAALVALRLPNQKTQRFSQRAWTLVWRLTKTMLIRKRAVRWTLLFFAAQNAITYGSFWIFQLQLEHAGWQVQHYGAFYLGIYALVLVISWLARSFWKQSSSLQMWGLYGLSCLCTTAAGLAGPTLMPWLSAATVCVNFALATPMLRYQLRIASREKTLPTTELSVASACMLVVFAVLGPIVGKIASAVSVEAANLVMGIVLVVMGGGSLLLLRRATQGE
jgi:MFS family permease